MRSRPPNQSERSSRYGDFLAPSPPPSLDVCVAVNGRKADTTTDHEQKLARKKTVPGPKRRRRAGRAVG